VGGENDLKTVGLAHPTYAAALLRCCSAAVPGGNMQRGFLSELKYWQELSKGIGYSQK
jgi:hypothetical protein